MRQMWLQRPENIFQTEYNNFAEFNDERHRIKTYDIILDFLKNTLFVLYLQRRCL